MGQAREEGSRAEDMLCVREAQQYPLSNVACMCLLVFTLSEKVSRHTKH